MTALTVMVKKHSQSKHHRGFHRGDRRSKICQAVQFLSPANEKVVSVFGSYETFWSVLRSVSYSFVTKAESIPHWVVMSDYLSRVSGQPVWGFDSRFPVFRLTSWLCARPGSKWNHAKLYGSLCRFEVLPHGKNMKVKKGESELLPRMGPVSADRLIAFS